MLLEEFKAYKPDIMCLQGKFFMPNLSDNFAEVDHVEDFFEDKLKALGYVVILPQL
jgi:mRNA deadenylase 3'-5' endonuclease subunit Ccr4